ncbi:hypothetical protein ACGFNV_31390 [Streptomyces sp. NPDC048751]|uniref:hypothetical protein n=1 Tax=Streptomyces sp. NPDC048751 TaxID=3365591 RepID=UPI0037224F16
MTSSGLHADGTLFTVGGHYTADLHRTPAGWRFGRVTVSPVWTEGRPPALSAPKTVADAA